ncbi:MAG TPA: hypothetical protein VFX12_02085 [Vicinamibacterales bacterium]|nr:hypothetical protein [Vicinamibacterales bacterium]
MPRGRPRKKPEDVFIKSAELIGWALGGIEREIAETRERLKALTSQAERLRARVGSRVKGRGPAAAASFDEPGITGAAPKRRRRHMSAEARKRISDMMRKRWAERKKAKS